MMKRFISFLVFCGLFSSTALFPYAAQKKGVIVEAVDHGRNPSALCVTAPLSDMVKHYFGKGVTSEMFVKSGMRPVGITITNTTDKPIMLAPAYSLKVINAQGMMQVMSGNEIMAQLLGFTSAGLATGYGALVFGILALIADDRESAVLGSLAGLCGAASVGCFGFVFWKSLLANEFASAMSEKFDELNFKDEALILPGKTIQKLFLTQNEAYISRFPLVLYPLENREDVIVFDVDLRS